MNRCTNNSDCLTCKLPKGQFNLPCEMHPIDKLAAEHETLARITAHLSNGEDDQAKSELSEMVWRLAGVADSLETGSTS